MNGYKSAFLIGSVLSLLNLNVHAINFNNVDADAYDPIAFGLSGGWTSGDLTLDSGTSIDSTPLQLDLFLTHEITLTDVGLGYNYGFGMSGFNPEVPFNGDAFNFTIQLFKNGAFITPAFGFDEINPFNFSVDNLGVTTSTTDLDSSLVFDQIQIQVSNSKIGGQGVESFHVELGVVPNPNQTVPDTSSTLPLLATGLVALIGFGQRKARISRQ